MSSAPRNQQPKYLVAPHDLDWQAGALCADKSMRNWHQLTEDEQKNVCRRCLVRDECLAWALTHPLDDSAVWGGLNSQERENIRRHRGQQVRRAREAAAR